MASAEPCTSALMTSGSSRDLLVLQLGHHVGQGWRRADAGASAFSRFTRVRYSVSSRARASFSTTAKRLARLGRAVQAEDLDRDRRTGFGQLLVALVQQGANPAERPSRPRRCRRASACRA